jgi:hypothetical protein
MNSGLRFDPGFVPSFLQYKAAESTLANLVFGDDQDFFWAEASGILRWTEPILARLRNCDVATQGAFWQGKMPRGLIDNLGYHRDELASTFLRRIPVLTLVEYCRVRGSAELAWSRLMVRAAGVKRDRRSALSMGGIPVNEQSYVLEWARRAKQINRVGMSFTLGPHALDKAKRDHDVRFLRALKRALQEGRRSGRVPPEVDWSRCSRLQMFLADFWCGWPLPYGILPPLCLFEGKARADLCAELKVADLSNDSRLNDAIRQEVKRLGLYRRRKGPKIHLVELRGDVLRFR